MSLPNAMSFDSKQPQHDKPDDDFDLYGYLFNPVEKLTQLWAFFGSMLYWTLRFMCVPAELIFRRGFGERHFNIMLYFGGSLWLLLYMTGFINILPASWGIAGEGYLSHVSVMWAVGIIFGSSLFWHMVIRRFFAIDVEIHSRYDGNPLGMIYKFFPYTYDQYGNPREALVRQVYEPLFIACLGIVAGFVFNPATGSFLVLSAVGLFSKELYKSRQVRNIILDKIDSDIVARQLTEALEGKSPKDTQGLYIAGVPNQGKQRERLKDIIAGKGTRQTAPEANADNDDTPIPASTFQSPNAS